MLAAEDEIATAQRLGYLMEQAGQAQLAAVIEKWLPRKRPLTPLVPTPAGRPAAPLAARWRVLDNSGEFNP